MENTLSTTWYLNHPIDFEHKQYLLFAYLQTVDNSFYNKLLSPHLLHLEELMDELVAFESSFNKLFEQLNQNRYIYFDNVKLEGIDNKEIYEIKDIVQFSIPQIKPRIELGYKILKKNNQILY
jgi:hypothetical protein